MASALKHFISRLGIVLVLPALMGCSTLLAPSTEDALLVYRNADQAYMAGEDARAEALYQGLLRVSPNDAEIWLRLGNLYARGNRADAAADAYQRSLLLNPADSRVWYNLGIIRQRQAHAAMLQTHQLSQKDDPLYARSEQLIRQLAPAKSEPAGNSDAAK